MRYPAYLEVGPGGWTLAFVFALPGVSMRARSPEAALAALPAAIAAERVRLVAAGRVLPAGTGVGAPIEVAEAERIEVAADVAGGATSALFRYELRATREEDVALALDRLALAQEEIAPVVTAHGPAAGGALAAALRALADGEWWLLSRLGNRPPAQLPPDTEPWARCEAVRAITVERLTHLLPGDHERHAVFGGEPWTTRKVLRRLSCHAREAAAGVQAFSALPSAPAVAAPPRAGTR
jgi:hypothetical protein